LEGVMTLRALRLRAGYKQSEVADYLGVCVPTLMKWEYNNSHMSLERLEQCSKLYSWPKDKIFVGSLQKFQDHVRRKTG
jgi:transcriptional regulator with XRE-family HTH domain